jgi:phospholipase C
MARAYRSGALRNHEDSREITHHAPGRPDHRRSVNAALGAATTSITRQPTNSTRHVPPPQDADQGRSFRVPLIVISPYVAPGRVTHEQYQHGSLLRFVEETFGVNPLSRLDARANSPLREFDFNRSPRAFTPIQ